MKHFKVQLFRIIIHVLVWKIAKYILLLISGFMFEFLFVPSRLLVFYPGFHIHFEIDQNNCLVQLLGALNDLVQFSLVLSRTIFFVFVLFSSAFTYFPNVIETLHFFLFSLSLFLSLPHTFYVCFFKSIRNVKEIFYMEICLN